MQILLLALAALSAYASASEVAAHEAGVNTAADKPFDFPDDMIQELSQKEFESCAHVKEAGACSHPKAQLVCAASCAEATHVSETTVHAEGKKETKRYKGCQACTANCNRYGKERADAGTEARYHGGSQWKSVRTSSHEC